MPVALSKELCIRLIDGLVMSLLSVALAVDDAVLLVFLCMLH